MKWLNFLLNPIRNNRGWTAVAGLLGSVISGSMASNAASDASDKALKAGAPSANQTALENQLYQMLYGNATSGAQSYGSTATQTLNPEYTAWQAQQAQQAKSNTGGGSSNGDGKGGNPLIPGNLPSWVDPGGAVLNESGLNVFKPKTSSSSSGSSKPGAPPQYITSYKASTDPNLFTAPMSSYEQSGLDMLDKYMKQQPSSYYGIAGDELKKTMGGEYDPASSPFYQAMRTSQNQNLADAKLGLGSDLSARGLFYSPARTKGLTDLTTGVTNNLNLTLGQMSENERQRRLSSVPYAMQLGGIEENRPAVMAQMAMQLGSIPRGIEQADKNAKYSEWLRQQNVDQSTVDQILSFLGRLSANSQNNMANNLAANQAGLAAGQSVGGGASALFNAIQGLFNTTPMTSTPATSASSWYTPADTTIRDMYANQGLSYGSSNNYGLSFI